MDLQTTLDYQALVTLLKWLAKENTVRYEPFYGEGEQEPIESPWVTDFSFKNSGEERFEVHLRIDKELYLSQNKLVRFGRGISDS